MAVIHKTPEAKQAAPTAVGTSPSDTLVSDTLLSDAAQTRSTERLAAGTPTASPIVRSTAPMPSTGTSDKLRLTYTVLLGAAACLALVGVITQNQTSDAGAPDAPPPAVLEQGS